MAFNFPILSFLILIPLVGVLLIYALSFLTDKKKCILGVGISVSLINFFLSLYLWQNFDSSFAGMQFVEKAKWFESWNIDYYLGIDGISLFLVLLTTFLIPLCLLASYNVTHKFVNYVALFLLLETLVIGSFCALDLIVFYIFFEAVLVPMFFIIGVWGGTNRVYASFKFFLYTLLGSLFMLIAVLYIYFVTGITDVVMLTKIVPFFHLDIQKWLWLGFFVSFAVKMPMWPVHTWLPDAHVQAPTGGSMILAGVLLKLGGYGFLRFSLPLFPSASIYFADFVFILSVIAVVYTSLVALVQTDMKKLIAYSSVAHMGFVTAGIYTFNHQGIDGAIFQMVSHGSCVCGIVFMCRGFVRKNSYERNKNIWRVNYENASSSSSIYGIYVSFSWFASDYRFCWRVLSNIISFSNSAIV